MPDNPIGEIIEAGATAFVAQCLEVPRQIVSRLYDPPPFGSFVRIGKQEAPPAPQVWGEETLQQGNVAQDPFGQARSTAGSTELPPPRLGGPGGPSEADDEPDPFATPSPAPPLLGAGGTSGAGGPALAPATFALVCGASTTSLEAGRRPSALGFADEDELRQQQPQIFELLRTEFNGLLLAYSDGKTLRRHLPPKPPRVHSRVYECTPDDVRMLTADLSFLRGILVPSGGAGLSVPPDELAAACLRQARAAHSDDREFLLRAGKTLAALLADDYDRLQAILRNVL